MVPVPSAAPPRILVTSANGPENAFSRGRHARYLQSAGMKIEKAEYTTELIYAQLIAAGITSISSLELGYLTPPVGMNLFLSSYRFNRPMPQIIRSVAPFMLVQLAAVLLVTFVPWLSEGFAHWWALP